jgi:hypothetical protein
MGWTRKLVVVLAVVAMAYALRSYLTRTDRSGSDDGPYRPA